MDQKTLEEKLLLLTESLEIKKKEKSKFKKISNTFLTFIKGFEINNDNISDKNAQIIIKNNFDGYKTMWNLEKNKQGLNPKFADAFNNYKNALKKIKEIDLEISKNENPNNLYAQINQVKAALRNSKISHYGKIIKHGETYILALEKKLKSNGGIKKFDEFKLEKLTGKGISYLKYESLTWKALEKICLLPTSSCKNKQSEEVISLWQKIKSNKHILKDTEKIAQIKNYLSNIMIQNKLSPDFNLREFQKCQNLSEIRYYFDEVCYKCEWTDCSFEELKKLDEGGDIDLYQIYCKDFNLSEYFVITDRDKKRLEWQTNNPKRGIRNLFTIYFEEFFEKQNFNTSRLQTEGKIYIRPADEYGINNVEKYGEIVEKKRYKENKVFADFLFKFNPVRTGNEAKDKVREAQKSKNSKERVEGFNDYLKTHTQNDKEIYVIGLDRGENSLVSYALCKFVKKNIDKDDVKVRFSDEDGTNGWVLDEIIEAKDLSAVKVFNKSGSWKKNEFVEQKDDIYFNNSKTENLEIIYFDSENKQNAESKKIELKNSDQSAEIVILPIRNKLGNKSGAYALKYLSWKENDGVCYNYRVAQEILKERRLEQKENLSEEMELINIQGFKNGFVSQFVGFLAEKVVKYDAFISFENLNHGSKNGNLQKTFGASVYQIIENKIMQKLSYCILKSNINTHSQGVPRIIRIDELKKDIVNGDEKNKDYSLGAVQITDEFNTSKICPCCGYSCSICDELSLAIEDNVLNFDVLSNEIDSVKKKDFIINQDTLAYQYSSDSVKTICLKNGDNYEYQELEKGKLRYNKKTFIQVLANTRQNETKSKDFIRCIHCGFDSRYPKNNHRKLQKIKNGDTLAAYNIAKRGLALISK